MLLWTRIGGLSDGYREPLVPQILLGEVAEATDLTEATVMSIAVPGLTEAAFRLTEPVAKTP